MRYEDAVVLVPGFLGFGRLGDFFYFADRLSASIRSVVESRIGRMVPVLSIATEPAGSLALRQRTLLRQLATVDRRLEGVYRFHLFGHSTGGLDAELLTWDRPLTPDASWSALDPQDVRRRIASITTISTPFHGTHLCDSDAVGFLARLIPSRPGGRDALRLVLAFGRTLAHRWLTLDALNGAAASWPNAARFFARLLSDRDLLLDLQPARMAALRAGSRRALAPQIASFVTTTPVHPIYEQGVPREQDDFFCRLRALTTEHVTPPPQLERVAELLRNHAHTAIRNPRAEVPSIAAASSDGVVNTMRQVLLPEEGQQIELGGIVIADHADVIGHYDRQDPLSVGLGEDERPINKGLFRSGAGFGDDQFFEMCSGVGARISRAIERGAEAITPVQRRDRVVVPIKARAHHDV